MNRIFSSAGYLVLLLILGCSANPSNKTIAGSIYDGIEFEMPEVEEPVFPDYSVSITDYGAVGDGQTLNTEAFAEAIAAVIEKGGGRVVIPRGVWLTGPIIMKSNIDLHAEAGALVVFSTDKDLYPLIESSFEGLETVRCISPISGRDLENIAFTGEGIYDGSGGAWRHVKRFKMTDSQWKMLLASGGVTNDKGNIWYPSEEFKRGAEGDHKGDYEMIKDYLRPNMVSLVKCKNVLLDGPVFQNSPAWCIHPLMCENLTIRNIDVRNPWYSQNGDGLDIESCKNSLVYNCTFDVGDDAICIKSGKDEAGRKRGMPTENVIVKNCVVYHGHGGVTIGSEMSGGVKNMHVSGCTFIGTDVGLRFKSTRGRGGVVEKIYISDIDMIDIPTNAISFNLYYGGLSVSEMLEQLEEGTQPTEIPPISEKTPQFKDISIRDINCRGARQAIYLQGLPEMNLENIILEDLTMEAENGLLCMDATGITIRNLNLVVKNHPEMTFHNSKNVLVEGLNLPDAAKASISVNGEQSENIRIGMVENQGSEDMLILGEKVKAGEIQVN